MCICYMCVYIYIYIYILLYYVYIYIYIHVGIYLSREIGRVAAGPRVAALAKAAEIVGFMLTMMPHNRPIPIIRYVCASTNRSI